MHVLFLLSDMVLTDNFVMQESQMEEEDDDSDDDDKDDAVTGMLLITVHRCQQAECNIRQLFVQPS